MKKVFFVLLVLGVLHMQRSVTGHTVTVPSVNWAVHGGCTTNGTYCMFYADSTVNSIVPTDTIYNGYTRTLTGKYSWTLYWNSDPYHPSNNISYKWCDKLVWRKPLGYGEEVLINHGFDGQPAYIFKSVNVASGGSFTDTLTHDTRRTMTPVGTHYLDAKGGVSVHYPETNDNTCVLGWHEQSATDTHSFNVY
ncbi:MAG: hypothetical protein KY468_00310 [Armatimonadetes bacterium]|nr:hypothetical protein [Armatimonadota bacterium]